MTSSLQRKGAAPPCRSQCELLFTSSTPLPEWISSTVSFVLAEFTSITTLHCYYSEADKERSYSLFSFRRTSSKRSSLSNYVGSCTLQKHV
ncbi:hypothetical protein TNCV_3834801 [Trichonephila clavipes]|nr:hypothetical protein TNCV_3834801 [Trichonephila clavipes]